MTRRDGIYFAALAVIAVVYALTFGGGMGR
jgi:hypothetical protein